MTQEKSKRPSYLETTLQEVDQIMSEAKDRDEATEQIKALLEKRVVDSFKNGITVGMKKAKKIE
jgi:hypothetical protein